LSSYSLRERVKYLPHGVKVCQGKGRSEADNNRKLRIVSIARLTVSKGVLLFFDINELLLRKGIEVEWIIIGSGELENELRQKWEKKQINWWPTSMIFLKPLNFF